MSEKVLFVHAHPDDETLSTGGTIATLIDAGAIVTVITCTRGELGEIVDPALAIARAELALVRERELAEALAVLGVTDHRFLGAANARWEGSEPRVYVDSGMRWGADGTAQPVTDVAPEALSSADFGEVGADIATVIADVLPDAVVSYDANGGYGHPDHVRAAAAARRAAEYMGVPYWSIAVGGAESDREVDVASVIERKRRALLAYRSQLTVGEDWTEGANGERDPISTVERFRRERSEEASDSSYSSQTLPLKLFTLLVCVILGAAAGLIFTAAHQASVPVAIAGVIASAALLAGLRTIFRSRLVAAVAAGGLAIGDLVLRIASSASADLVKQNPQGIVWTWGVVVVIALVLALPGFRRARRG